MTEHLWQSDPDRARTSAMQRFIDVVSAAGMAPVTDAVSLHAWSIAQPQAFWQTLFDFVHIPHTGHAQPAFQQHDTALTPLQRQWFPQIRLNIVDALLAHAPDDSPAIIAWDETRQSGIISWRDLHQQVGQLAAHLAQAGVGAHSRAFAYLPNTPAAVIGMLACAHLGATWASCGTDYQHAGVVARGQRIQPEVVFVCLRYRWRGRIIDTTESVRQLLASMPSIRTVVVVDPVSQTVNMPSEWIPQYHCINFHDIGTQPPMVIPARPQFAFDHPLYHVFSSGTTGIPKGMVHGAGGTLLEHLKEHILHGDLRPGERILFYTSTSWMMWQWLVSALAAHATIVLYDGDPFVGDGDILWHIAAQSQLTHVGSSAAYFQLMQDRQLAPRHTHDLTGLVSILATGSTLHAHQYAYLREAIAPVRIASISGGTDIIGCFALGNPLLPTQAGRLQCKSLGVDIVAVDELHQPIVGQIGELICRNPIPSMPVAFLDDADGADYRAAYFARIPDVWHHGDMVMEYLDGSMAFLGRSDATLNPGGVRIATADLYAAVLQISGISDALAVGYTSTHHPIERIILFVVLDSHTAYDDELDQHIRQHLRQYNVYYVPWQIVVMPQVPRTHNNKLAELTVKRIIHGQAVSNAHTLRNPECLAEYVAFASLVLPRYDHDMMQKLNKQ